MTCQIARAFHTRFTDFTFGIFGKTTGRQEAFHGFHGFHTFSLKGYVRARARLPLTLTLCLARERIREIRETRETPRAVWRFGWSRLPGNRCETGVKWGWLCCQT